MKNILAASTNTYHTHTMEEALAGIAKAGFKNLELGGLLPGIKVNTSATDFAPISQVQLMRFKGEKWELFGDIISADVGG